MNIVYHLILWLSKSENIKLLINAIGIHPGVNNRTNLAEQAKSNTIENFKFGFEELFMASLISRMDQNQEIFTKIMDDAEFGRVVRSLMLNRVYNKLQSPNDY